MSEKPYDEYLEAVEKCMQNPFLNKTWALFRVPPVYRDKILEHLQKKYPQYQTSTYEISGIWMEADLPVHIREAIREVNFGSGLIETKFIEEVCEALSKEFPDRKFEIQENSEIYAGTEWMSKNSSGRQIVIDDFEYPGKWGPTTHRSGDLDWLLSKIGFEIENGHKVFDTNRDEEVARALRIKFPHHTFEIKRYDDVFYWEKRNKKYYDGPEYETIVIMDGFVPPVPKKYLKGLNP